MSLIEDIVMFLENIFQKLYTLVSKVFRDPNFQRFAPIIMDFATEAYKRMKEADLSGAEKKARAVDIVYELATEKGIEVLNLPVGIINGAIEDVHRLELVKENPNVFKEIADKLGDENIIPKARTARERREETVR